MEADIFSPLEQIDVPRELEQISASIYPSDCLMQNSCSKIDTYWLIELKYN